MRVKEGLRYLEVNSFELQSFHKSHLQKLRVAPSETAMTDVLREVYFFLVSFFKKNEQYRVIQGVPIYIQGISLFFLFSLIITCF